MQAEGYVHSITSRLRHIRPSVCVNPQISAIIKAIDTKFRIKVVVFARHIKFISNIILGATQINI